MPFGGAEEPEVATADGEHGAKGEVEFVGDEGGFVDDKEREGGEAADGFLGLAGQADDAGAVGEKGGGRKRSDGGGQAGTFRHAEDRRAKGSLFVAVSLSSQEI